MEKKELNNMEKKELNNEELKNVNGGEREDKSEHGIITCPKCRYYDVEHYFEPQQIGSGCDEETQYKCPSCSHVFTK